MPVVMVISILYLFT